MQREGERERERERERVREREKERESGKLMQIAIKLFIIVSRGS